MVGQLPHRPLPCRILGEGQPHQRCPLLIEGDDDVVLPFAVEALDVRGRVVRLGPSVDTILRRHGYPDAVARLLGEGASPAVIEGQVPALRKAILDGYLAEDEGDDRTLTTRMRIARVLAHLRTA